MMAADSGHIGKVLFAVRLVDPVTGGTVSSGVCPVPHDSAGHKITARPIINASGIFVWTAGRGVVWPKRIKVESAAGRWTVFWQDVPPPAAVPKPHERLITLALRPSAAFLPDAGVTALRGRLYDRPGPARTAMPGALVRLVAGAAGALPAITPPADMIPTAGTALTADDGAFLVFARSAAPAFATTADDRVRLRLLVTVTSVAGVPATRATPPAFEFLPGQPGVPVPDGRPLPHDYTLSWTELLTA